MMPDALIANAAQRVGAAALTREVGAFSQLGASLQPLLWEAQGLKTLVFDPCEVAVKSPGKDKRRAKARRREQTEETFAAVSLSEGWAASDMRWGAFTKHARIADHRLKKAAGIAQGLPDRLGKAVPAGLEELRDASSVFAEWEDSPYRPRALSLLRRHGYDPSLVDRIDRKLIDADGDLASVIGADSAEGLIEGLALAADGFHRMVRDDLALAGSDRERAAALRPMALSGNPEIKLDCSWLEGDLELICIIVAIAIVVVLLVVIVAGAIGDWIDWLSEDDKARDVVNSSTCEEINRRSDSSLRVLIVDMLDGFTGDADEKAILRILDCLPCDRVRRLVGDIGLGWFLDDIDGAEWDRLMIRLRECGLVSFRDWDDDASRRFVNGVDCGVIARLSEDDIRQLMFNFFDGFTGDADERAILRIVNCLDCAQVRSLVQRGGMSVEDFDDEVDGVEWRALAQRFSACGVST
jgi:hypothetical protein